MLRSTQVLGLGTLVVAACAQTSQQPSAVTAPTTSAAATESAPVASSPLPTPTVGVSAPGPATSQDAAASETGSADAAGLPAQYRTCRADADCLAVPVVACCPHGYLTAVNPSQKDAYERDYACTKTPRPMCPMFRVRDTRVARCDTSVHLCDMVKP